MAKIGKKEVVKNKKEIQYAFNRVVKLLKVANNVPASKKRKDVVRHFCLLYAIPITTTGGHWFNLMLIELYKNADSPIYKYKKLPVLPSRKKKKKLIDEWWDRYNRYLKSKKWADFRNKIKQERGNKCEKCNRKNVVLQGHHLTYERVFNELPEDIQILCKKCHEKVHKKKT